MFVLRANGEKILTNVQLAPIMNSKVRLDTSGIKVGSSKHVLLTHSLMSNTKLSLPPSPKVTKTTTFDGR